MTGSDVLSNQAPLLTNYFTVFFWAFVAFMHLLVPQQVTALLELTATSLVVASFVNME